MRPPAAALGAGLSPSPLRTASRSPAAPEGRADQGRARAGASQDADAKQKRPNVIVVMTDDQNESMLGLT